MEYDNINMSNVEEVIEQTVKKELETVMKIEHDQYLEENLLNNSSIFHLKLYA